MEARQVQYPWSQVPEKEKIGIKKGAGARAWVALKGFTYLLRPRTARPK